MKHCLLLLGIVALVACHKQAAQSFGVAVPGPANPVVPVDPSGNYPAAFTTTGAGGYVTIDGGSVTTTSGSVTTLQDSGVTVLGTAAVDTYNTLSALVVQTVPVTQQILIDAGTRCITDINFTNEGTVGGYAQIFCGQYTPDAGGTAAAGTAPSFQIKCPAGTVCGDRIDLSPLCCAGAVWYSGVDAGFLLSTGAPAMTLTHASIR